MDSCKQNVKSIRNQTSHIVPRCFLITAGLSLLDVDIVAITYNSFLLVCFYSFLVYTEMKLRQYDVFLLSRHGIVLDTYDLFSCMANVCCSFLLNQYCTCLLRIVTDTYNVPIFFHIHVYTEYYIRYSQLTFLMSILYQNNVLAVHLSWQYCIYT